MEVGEIKNLFFFKGNPKPAFDMSIKQVTGNLSTINSSVRSVMPPSLQTHCQKHSQVVQLATVRGPHSRHWGFASNAKILPKRYTIARRTLMSLIIGELIPTNTLN